MVTPIETIMAQDLTPQDRANALNELGRHFHEQQEMDAAIACWEQSIACYGKPGFAQAQLMKAYNAKRRQCSEAGDAKGLEDYSTKIDMLMQKSKDAIRYGY
ncbi:hypothetical protein PCO85_15655 [Prodigiosinella aquatilis]|nr:hypothetical protein [Prodigiosinella sp. LS101]WJV52652.1 hypothetical protein PCO85_15655 [Prodigiosinella sp. LS101]WJV57006.1 hypothetical protein PCO84_15635 [Pectobacteriaceae bacterium C111]